MDILLIGNGFDLAHKLPTKYTDFLNFCEIIESEKKMNKKQNNNFIISKVISQMLLKKNYTERMNNSFLLNEEFFGKCFKRRRLYKRVVLCYPNDAIF